MVTGYDLDTDDLEHGVLPDDEFDLVEMENVDDDSNSAVGGNGSTANGGVSDPRFPLLARKRKKNPAAPKNPRSAYLYYVAEQRPILARDKRASKVCV